MSFYLPVLSGAVCRGGRGDSELRWPPESLLVTPPPTTSARSGTSPRSSVTAPRSSLLKRSPPSPFFYFSFHMFVYLSPSFTWRTATPPPPPPTPSFLQANRSIAKNSSVGLLRIYICKWEPALLVDLQLSKQLKLTNNVGPHYFTNNRVSCALIYFANPYYLLSPAFMQLVEDNVLDPTQGLWLAEQHNVFRKKRSGRTLSFKTQNTELDLLFMPWGQKSFWACVHQRAVKSVHLLYSKNKTALLMGCRVQMSWFRFHTITYFTQHAKIYNPSLCKQYIVYKKALYFI